MGVAGSGKTTVGTALAARLDLEFFDADLAHSFEAREQMAHGVPLTDVQRDAWIERVLATLRERPPRVVACSALRRHDRDRMRAVRPMHLVLLDVPAAVLAERLARRAPHFFPASLLQSQLDRFEAPAPDEDILVVDATRSVTVVVGDIVDHIADRLSR